MSKWPRYRVIAVWILGERYEADGWLELRTRGPDLRSWESRCNLLRWNHRDLTGSIPISVRVELAAGGELSGKAYVDQPLHVGGNETDLAIHGTEQGLEVKHLGPADYVVAPRETFKQALLVPFRVTVFVLVTVVSIVVVVLLLALLFAPEPFFKNGPAF